MKLRSLWPAFLLTLGFTAFVVAAMAQTMSVATTQVTVTPNAAAYSAGQCIGGVLTVPNMVRVGGPGGTILSGVTLVDPQHQTAANDAMDLLVFSSLPSGTYTDHANCQVAAADASKLAGFVTIAAGNCTQDQGPANTVCTITPALPVSTAMPVVSTNLYVVPIAKATPTYGAAASLFFSFMATPFHGI